MIILVSPSVNCCANFASSPLSEKVCFFLFEGKPGACCHRCLHLHHSTLSLPLTSLTDSLFVSLFSLILYPVSLSLVRDIDQLIYLSLSLFLGRVTVSRPQDKSGERESELHLPPLSLSTRDRCSLYSRFLPNHKPLPSHSLTLSHLNLYSHCSDITATASVRYNWSPVTLCSLTVSLPTVDGERYYQLYRHYQPSILTDITLIHSLLQWINWIYSTSPPFSPQFALFSFTFFSSHARQTFVLFCHRPHLTIDLLTTILWSVTFISTTIWPSTAACRHY